MNKVIQSLLNNEDIIYDGDFYLDDNPIIEELYESEEELEEFAKSIKSVPKIPPGTFPEWCSDCRKQFYIPKNQLFCPRCGLPIIREEEDGLLSHER